jgi:hypothetical protein
MDRLVNVLVNPSGRFGAPETEPGPCGAGDELLMTFPFTRGPASRSRPEWARRARDSLARHPGLRQGADGGCVILVAQKASDPRLMPSAGLPQSVSARPMASFGHLVQVIRHGLKEIQYRSRLIEGCLAGTGLALNRVKRLRASIIGDLLLFLLVYSGLNSGRRDQLTDSRPVLGATQ